MRILRYDLTAFGPFTGLSLDLAAPGVHLVVGPNEAGKSTARHALGQLLYGIDERTPYDFVHAKRDLRLGALIGRRDGGTLEIVRVKSRKAPLRTPDGDPIDQSVLSAVLGGIDRQTFTAEFALSSAELREGGKALVAGKGELSQALAASRSGLRLTRVQEAIKARMEELYKPRGTRPAINTKLRELKETNARKRKASLRPDDYLAREREVERARQELERLKKELLDLRADHLRLERLDQALPQLNRRRHLLEELDRIRAEGPLAPPDAAERFPHLMEELRQARRSEEQAGTRIENIDRQLAELHVDETLAAHADAIEALLQDMGAAQEAAERLEHLAGRAAERREEAAALLARVHPDAALADERRYRIPQAVREQARELSERRTALDAELRERRQARDDRHRKLQQARRRLAGLPPVPDDRPLRSALDAVPDDLLHRLTTTAAEVNRHRNRAAAIRERLGLPEDGAVAVPSREQVDAHRQEADRIANDRRNLADRIAELTERLEEQRLELEGLRAHDPPPTPEDLAAARARRDELWDGLPGTESEYLRAVRHADEIADRMFREAERVNRLRETRLAIERDERRLARLQADHDALASREAELEAAWRRLWEGYAGPVPPPEAAADALEEVRRLQETQREGDDAAALFEALADRAARHAARLRDLLDHPAGSDDPWTELPELQRLGRQRLEEWQETAAACAAAEEKVAAEEHELEEAEAACAHCERRLEEWRERWERLLGEAGLPAGREPVGALADLDLLARAEEALADADRIDREAQEAERKVARFHEELTRLADRCGREVPADPAERRLLVRALHQDAKDNRDRAAERDRLRRDREEHRAERDQAAQAVALLQAELEELMRATGACSVEELDAAVRRRDRHTEQERKLKELTETIVCGPHSLEELMAEAAETDPVRLRADLEELSGRIEELESLRTRLQDTFTRSKAELDRLDGSAEAAQAAAEAETLGAALVEEAEEYLRLEIAHAILLECAETYRSAQQDPVLERAGHLFGELTRGRFSGVELDPDEDPPVIVARRSGGELLRVHQLSEATADQLYLALRLASLERYAQEDRALPFTVDDIFMTFDDARTRAALQVLDGMADRFQVIVFTHHEHLAALARQALPPGRVHVHTLPEYRPGELAPAAGA